MNVEHRLKRSFASVCRDRLWGVEGIDVMADTPPYRLDIEGLEDEAAPVSGRKPRAWLGIHFDCCGVYTRIYRNRAGTAYEGVCPRCARRVVVRVGEGGTDARFFVAE